VVTGGGGGGGKDASRYRYVTTGVKERKNDYREFLRARHYSFSSRRHIFF